MYLYLQYQLQQYKKYKIMRFNFFERNKVEPIINYQGAKAFAMTPEMELYSAVVTAGLSNTFYEKADARLERIKLLMANCSLPFIAKLAIYTRTQMHMRSIAMVLIVEMAKRTRDAFALSRVIPKVVLRADEITELLAYYQLANSYC